MAPAPDFTVGQCADGSQIRSSRLAGRPRQEASATSCEVGSEHGRKHGDVFIGDVRDEDLKGM